MEVAILFGMVIGLLIIGVPIAISLGLSSIIFLLIYSESSLGSIAQTLFNAFAGHFTLLAIPFFILASTFMSTGGVARRIIRFAIACVGHFQGGLAIAGVFACMLFAALSGSSPATVVAIGTIVIAGMRQVGYTKDFAAGRYLQRGHAGHPDPALDCHGGLCLSGRRLGRPDVPGRRDPRLAGRPDADDRHLRCGEDPQPAGAALGGLGRDLRCGARFRLGPVPDRHHPGRHLRRHLHADRSRGGGCRLRLLHRQLRLQGHGAAAGRGRPSPQPAEAAASPADGLPPPGHEALAVRGRQDHDHAALHHRQRADPEARAD